MAIETNISLNKTEKQYYQRFVNLAVNDKPLPQGDATIRITPFDDYYLFTIYDEVQGEDTPIDLSNVGDLYLNFIGENDDIDIKNHTQVAEVDLARGEVLFRITRDDSKKILALDNNNFYISTKMIDPSDGSTSDESVLYQGLWLAVDDANRISLQSQIEEQRLEYTIELARLKDELDAVKAENANLLNGAAEDDATIAALQASNLELTDEVARLSAELGSTKNAFILKSAQEAQALAELQKLRRQQILAMKQKAIVAQTQSKKKFFFRQSAKNLQNYTTRRNPVGRSTFRDELERRGVFGRNFRFGGRQF